MRVWIQHVVYSRCESTKWGIAMVAKRKAKKAKKAAPKKVKRRVKKKTR